MRFGCLRLLRIGGDTKSVPAPSGTGCAHSRLTAEENFGDPSFLRCSQRLLRKCPSGCGIMPHHTKRRLLVNFSPFSIPSKSQTHACTMIVVTRRWLGSGTVIHKRQRMPSIPPRIIFSWFNIAVASPAGRYRKYTR